MTEAQRAARARMLSMLRCRTIADDPEHWQAEDRPLSPEEMRIANACPAPDRVERRLTQQ